MEYYAGVAFSEGVAIGKLRVVTDEVKEINVLTSLDEAKKFEDAVKKSIDQIIELKNADTSDEDYLIVQQLLISDYVFKNKTLEMISKGMSAISSVNKVLDDYALSIASSTNAYLQERVLDIKDVKQRIIDNIIGKENVKINDDFILYAPILRPSFLIQNKKNIVAVITENGGYNSHGAILCRQLNIPYMLCPLLKSFENKIAIVDTHKRQIIIDPTKKVIEDYSLILNEISKEKYKAISHKGMGFYANVSSNIEIDKVIEYDFDGIGLYRTEMIFMNSNRPYTFEEQFQIYKEAINKLNGKRICFRTFDIGDDKQLSYIKTGKKGIRNYIDNPLLFKTQIKALLMASKYGNIRIMFPMITSHSDFSFLKNWVVQIKRSLNIKSYIEIGMMLETKEAMENINDFKDVDFISIGTNDLVLSIYHINRDIQDVKMQQYLKDLAGKIKNVVEFCEENKIDLSICGELAAIPQALNTFIKIGVKNFCVGAPAIRILNKAYKETKND